VGNCCVDNDCVHLGNNYTCQRHQCTKCAQATNSEYYVDPAHGSDTAGTGAAAGDCAFKTIDRALSFIGTAVGATTIYLVKGTAASTATGESFPIVVPQHMTIKGSGGLGSIVAPAGQDAIHLIASSSGLESLSIDGSANTARYGIWVGAGTGKVTTTINDVVVQNFLNAGIEVLGPMTIGHGVEVKGTGTSTVPSSGLNIGTGGAVILNVPAGQAVSSFHNNAGNGIIVHGTGSITLTGVPGSTHGTGTVVASHNAYDGLAIYQTPSAGKSNAVTGLASFANTRAGLSVSGGSDITLRDSVLLGNTREGVLIYPYPTTTPNNTVNLMDLGTGLTAGTAGGNIIQAAAGSDPNVGSGICMILAADQSAHLNARGNIFQANNCQTTTGTPALTHNATCTGGVDVSIQHPGSGTTANGILTAKCTN